MKKVLSPQLLGWFAVAALGLCSASASAQQYKSETVDDRARLLSSIAQNCAKVPGRYAVDKDRFTEFFEKYYFPAMTQNSSEDLAKLGGMREDLFKNFLWATRDEQLQEDLTKIAIKKTWPITTNNSFHPSVRYNAVLILGRLDKQYGIDSASGRRPPIPLEEATEKLVLVVDSAAQGKAVPPYVLVGALVGLDRHVQYTGSLSRQTVASINAAVSKLVIKEVPLPDVDTKVVEWIRMQAATVLAKLGSGQPTAEQLAAIDKLIAGDTVPKMSLDVRCQAAALLGLMKLDGAALDGKATTEALLSLALSVANDEAKEAKAFQDMNLQGGGFRGNMGGSKGPSTGRMKMNLNSQEMEIDNRVFLARLGDLKRGLIAAKPIVPADKKPVVDTIIAAIGPAVAAVESSDMVDLAKADQIVAMADEIRSAVKPGSAPLKTESSGDVF